MKTYELEFHEAALKEWRRLDNSVQSLFKKQLAKRLQTPHLTSAKLQGAQEHLQDQAAGHGLPAGL